jgi:protein-disulfide isomerase
MPGSDKEDKDDNRTEGERKRKKDLAFKVLVSILALAVAALVIPQMLSISGPGEDMEREEFNLSGQPVKGEADAEVTIVEFGDYLCPGCQAFEQTVMPRIERNFIETGDAKLYYLDFPLERHDPEATLASIAAQCVHKQDVEEFWSYHESLYTQQREIEYNTDGLVSLAEDQDSEIDTESLRSCIESRETEAQVKADRTTGIEKEIPGTPTIYVNGAKASSISYSSLESLIESEMEN